MNIFQLSKNPDFFGNIRENAIFYNDKHVIKMIVESVQMLSTSLHIAAAHPHLVDKHLATLATYMPPAVRSTHENHPCTVWARANIHNFTWLAYLAFRLCKEKEHRYPTKLPHIYSYWLAALLKDLRPTPMAPQFYAIAIADSEIYPEKAGVIALSWRSLDETANLYRAYYIKHKASFSTWTGRDTPLWFCTSKANQQ